MTPEVFLVQRLRTEPRRAETAVEQAVSFVDLDVRLEMRETRECSHAHFTLQSVFVFDVLSQVRRGREDFVALVAAEVLRVGVNFREVLAEFSQ